MLCVNVRFCGSVIYFINTEGIYGLQLQLKAVWPLIKTDVSIKLSVGCTYSEFPFDEMTHRVNQKNRAEFETRGTSKSRVKKKKKKKQEKFERERFNK